jgi:uncharacterized membrane protein
VRSVYSSPELGDSRASAWRSSLALYLVAVFPGNVYAAVNEVPFRGEPPTPLWLRTPIQLLFIGVVLWTSVVRKPLDRVEAPRVGEPPPTGTV